MLRRELLARSGLALAAGAMGSSAGLLDAAAQDNPLEGADGLDWPAVRAQFALSDAFIHMSAMLLSSHGFGSEDVVLADLGCDFFMAGCHKWLFGPRGTGIVAGTQRAWASLLPTIPSFIDSGNWRAWSSGTDPEGPTTASRVSPGGYKAFEHLWALPKAFEFHQRIGKARVAERTHDLAAQLKPDCAPFPRSRSIRRSPKSSRPASSPSTSRASRPAPWSIVCVDGGSSRPWPPMRCRMPGSRQASRTPLPRSRRAARNSRSRQLA